VFHSAHCLRFQPSVYYALMGFREEWRGLAERLNQRLIRALDIASILLLDAVILLIGYGLLKLVDSLTDSGNSYFSVAVEISGGTFLLLYLVFIVRDLWDFLQSS